MSTIAAGTSSTLYIPIAQSLTITPGTSGKASLNGRNQDGSAITPQEIYSATTIALRAGATITVEAINVDATCTDVADSLSSVSGALTPEQVASILEYLSLRAAGVFTFTTPGSGYTAAVPAGAQFCYIDIAGGGGGGGGGFGGATAGGGGGGGNAETGFSVGPFRVTAGNTLTVQVGAGCNGGAIGAAGATVTAANSSIVAGLDDFGGTITYRGGREGSPGTNTNGGAGATGGNGATSGGATGSGAGAAGTGQNSVSGAGGWYASGAGAGGGPTSNGGVSGRLTAPGYTAFQNGGNTGGTLGGGGAGGSSPWGPGGRGGDVGTNAGAGNSPVATSYGAGGGGGAGNAVGAKGADGIVRVWFV